MVDHQIVSSESDYLFASLSQLELLWQNEIRLVKIMEGILADPLAEYRPLTR